MEAIQLLVLDDFSEVCNMDGHNNRIMRVLNYKSGEKFCTRCEYDVQSTIKVSSQLQTKSVRDKFVIQLRANHDEGVCEVNDFCSLSCKVEHLTSNSGVKKRRRGGRKRGDVSIFHKFFGMFLIKRKARSQGRRRRAYGPVNGNLPPKKRYRGG